MTFKLQRIQSEGGRMIYVVYPKGYDYGQGFSTLENAFAHIRLILRNQ